MAIDSDIGLRNEVQRPRTRTKRLRMERRRTNVKRPRIDVERLRWRGQGSRKIND